MHEHVYLCCSRKRRRRRRTWRLRLLQSSSHQDSVFTQRPGDDFLSLRACPGELSPSLEPESASGGDQKTRKPPLRHTGGSWQIGFRIIQTGLISGRKTPPHGAMKPP